MPDLREEPPPDRMRAILYHEYGPADALRLEEVERPSPGEGQVLVQIRAASVNPLDWRFLRGEPYPIRLMLGRARPKDPRLGRDLAGRVEAVGPKVSRFRPGDAVFGAALGALADYACADEARLAAKPARLSFEEAAALPVAASTALQALRDPGRVRAGQQVLIHGASGGVGTFAVQIAKAFGAEVTGVCSTRNLELVRSIGADHTVDYTREDFTASGRRYDLILDCVGNRPLSAVRRALAPRGIYVVVGAPGGRWIGPLLPSIKASIASPFVSQRLLFFTAAIKPEDLEALGRLIVDGKVTPVLDRRYPLSQAAEAIRYLEEGHARGKVILIPERGEGA